MPRPRRHWTTQTGVPPPADSPVSRLEHTLAHYPESESPDDEFALTATSNLYDDDLTTGVTWGDLRRILAVLQQVTAVTLPAAKAQDLLGPGV